MTARPTIHVSPAPGGWPPPWPAVAELAEVLPHGAWTLVGGLMTQLHTVHRQIGILRPTNDVDIVLHIETLRGVPNAVATALEEVGYRLQTSMNPRDNTAHRFVREGNVVDVVTDAHDEERVDVLIADHPAPRTIERLRGRDMVKIDGGTQALRRTVNARMEIVSGRVTTLSVPRPFAATILKAAAYVSDSRDRDRHLFDAAALLACIEDPFAEASGLAGSDRSRLAHLRAALEDGHPAWRALPANARVDGLEALHFLGSA